MPLDDAHTLAAHTPLSPFSYSFALSSLAPQSQRSELPHSHFFRWHNQYLASSPSLHMTNSDSNRNDMLYSLYSGVASHTHTPNTHSHSRCALVCASECAFDDLQKVLRLLLLPRPCIPCKMSAKGAKGVVELAWICLVFIVVARVFHLHDKNQWQRLRFHAPFPLFLSLLAHMRGSSSVWLRVGAAAAAASLTDMSRKVLAPCCLQSTSYCL